MATYRDQQQPSQSLKPSNGITQKKMKSAKPQQGSQLAGLKRPHKKAITGLALPDEGLKSVQNAAIMQEAMVHHQAIVIPEGYSQRPQVYRGEAEMQHNASATQTKVFQNTEQKVSIELVSTYAS